MDSPFLIGAQLQPDRIVEITRSFTYRLNVGNYESRDFFCSQKSQCREDEAAVVSEKLYRFCKSQVMDAVREELQLQALRQEKRKTA